jgi:hypothetical protein
MPIASATFQLTVAATANETAALTTRTAQTTKRDTMSYADGNGTLAVSAIVDANATIAANSTTVVLSSLTDTLEAAFTWTELKAWRISTPSTNNGTVTVTSNITGFPSNWTMPPNSTIGFATSDANGTAVAGTNNVTFAGTDGDGANLTLFVS